MHTRRRIILLLLLASPACLSGCNTTRARSAPTRSSVVKAQTPPPSPSKHKPRDSAFSVYNNPAYGVSFRYPRTYSLAEEDLADGSSLKTQQQLQSEQPGALLIATVEIPSDAYPNTTFSEGHLQFAVNPQATAESCRSFVAPPDSDWSGATDQTVVQGIPFYWRDRGLITSESITCSRDYAGYLNGTCYEFYLQVVSTPASSSAVPINQADLGKILRPFEKTISSLQLHPEHTLQSHK
ncbi:MAG TPA: hypothetical protein VIW93_16770 [Candidatus Acidoferrum sp.]